MHAHHSEDLEAAAALAREKAPALCRRDAATGASCDWNHGLWPTLRLLGIVTEPAIHAEFLLPALASLAGTRPRILLSGAADHALLAQVLAAFPDRAPECTVLDLCETPLMLNRWFAERAGIAIETRASNILDFTDARGYDGICTHAFLSYFDQAQRVALVAKWRSLLRPGGKVITVNRLRPASAPQWIAFSTDQVWAFRNRVEEAAQARGLDLPRLGRAAEIYASRQAIFPLRSEEELRALFEVGGFQVEALTPDAVAPVARLKVSVPTVPSGERYARLIAVRR
jgi:hypothetical protein